MKASSIVDGIKQQSTGEVTVVHLNLLGKVGREVAATYGVMLVPATVLIDQNGAVRYRHNGFPEPDKIYQVFAA